MSQLDRGMVRMSLGEYDADAKRGTICSRYSSATIELTNVEFAEWAAIAERVREIEDAAVRRALEMASKSAQKAIGSVKMI